MIKRIVFLITTVALVSCSSSNNEVKKKKPELNKLQKTMCFLRLRNNGCDQWISEETT